MFWRSGTNFRKCYRSYSSTIDSNEMKHFQKFSTEWWDEFGPFKALHSMNKLRIPMIRDAFVNSNSNATPMKGISALDVGCGGGILSEPLARLGGSITGIDANAAVIESAQSHAKSLSLQINYMATSIEDHAAINAEKYDIVVASEILEHVTQKHQFLDACVKCLKPNGSIFVTTMNKTNFANIFAIILAEKVFNLLPDGTHEIDKFIEPHRLQRHLEEVNCRTVLVHGMFYNVLTNNWQWISDTSINYAMHAIKNEVT